MNYVVVKFVYTVNYTAHKNVSRKSKNHHVVDKIRWINYISHILATEHLKRGTIQKMGTLKKRPLKST